MKNIQALLKFFQADRKDVLGLDFGASGTKVVRLKTTEEKTSLLAADILPPVSAAGGSASITVPRPLQARYAAIATSTPGAVVKLLTLPLHSDKPTDVHVNELMGLGDSTDFRVGYEHVFDSRTERRVLAVALPDASARAFCHLFPTGIPAPCSIEVAGLATMTAFARGPGANHKSDTVAALDFGATTTYVAFFNKGVMSLIRKFDFGSIQILKKLQESLGVEEEVAFGILYDQSFDVSKILRQTMEPFLQQMTISWDFVERRENSAISHFYVCGGLTAMKSWQDEVKETTGHEPATWNPFASLDVQPSAIPSRLIGQESRFAAAIGAAYGVMLGNA